MEEQDGYSWSWIWKLNSAENIKFLVWLSCHDATPTLDVLHHRGMYGTSICERCSGDVETFIHSVRECPYSKRICMKLGFSDNTFFFQMDMQEWLKVNPTGSYMFHFIVGLCGLGE